jgi:ribonuclease BN (tRNA processing enzyme)
MHSFSQTVSDYLDLLNSIEKNWDTTKEEIIQTEKEQQDLLHEIELTKFDIQKGYGLAKKLQDVRQRRRQLKNRMEILGPLKDFHDRNQKMKIDLFKVQTKIKQVQQTQEAKDIHSKGVENSGIRRRGIGEIRVSENRGQVV